MNEYIVAKLVLPADTRHDEHDEGGSRNDEGGSGPSNVAHDLARPQDVLSVHIHTYIHTCIH